MATSHPPLMWAQDRNQVFITIKLQDVANETIQFNTNSFVFKGTTTSPPMEYDMTLELFGNIDPESRDTKYAIFGRNVKIELKKNDARSWWPRLAKTTNKLHNVKIDWERWVDNEEDFDDDLQAKEEVLSSSSSSSDDEEQKVEEVQQTETPITPEAEPEDEPNTV